MEIDYKTCLVGFVDVMGFKELLKDTPSNKKKLSSYFSHVHHSKEIEKLLGEDGLQIMAVSDSIVYSIALVGDPQQDLERTAGFIKALAVLQYNLAAHNCIWTRGGISVGNLQMDENSNFIVGQAFVDALNLESAANYPRIILDPKVFRYFKRTPQAFCDDLRANHNTPIMDFKYDNPISLPPWPNDFVQVDWFGWGLDLKSKTIKSAALENISGLTFDLELKDFFLDLLERQNSDPSLFLKSQALLRYLLQSRYQFDLRKGDRTKPHVEVITKQLRELTGIDMTNPPVAIMI